MMLGGPAERNPDILTLRWLGTANYELTIGGRVILLDCSYDRGPRGRPLVTFPTRSVNAAVLEQDTSAAIVNVAQPITDLMKVRQGVRIAQADEGIAQAEWEKGIRALASGGINVQMINTSEIRLSIVVARDKGAAAHECLLKTFGLG